MEEAWGEGTFVTVTENGFCDGRVAEVGGAAGVTVTSGSMVELRLRGGSGAGVTVKFLPLAADKPSTISSSFFLFFSFPTTCSGAGCNKNYIVEIGTSSQSHP